jgi:S1-C subfamily serine protease
VTNAHVVADHTFVLVRKHGSPTKYKAEVQAVGHECDLALLSVESEEFWEGMHFLELGDIPYLQEAVAVVGYPQGTWLNSQCSIFVLRVYSYLFPQHI